MASPLARFELFARASHTLDESVGVSDGPEHPFDARNIHPGLPRTVRSLFDSGHYSQSAFEAFKFLEKEVRRHASTTGTGKSLMMKAFSEASPMIQLTPQSNETEHVEQEGYKFVFAGSMMAIRDPRGHDPDIVDDSTACLDFVTLVSMLLRRLAKAGFHVRGIR